MKLHTKLGVVELSVEEFKELHRSKTQTTSQTQSSTVIPRVKRTQKNPNAYRIWTAEDDTYIIEKRKIGTPYKHIAYQLGRTESAVGNRAYDLRQQGRM